ncbi:hypothetical protein IAT40_005809 [Kwoniella sp. CBS 6097]
MGGDIPSGPWAVPFSVAAMALHKPSLPQKLQPVNPPIGVYPEFAGQNGATLILQEKPFDFDGEDFIVRTTDGMDVLRCKNAGGAKGKKVIADPNGVPLITIKNKPHIINKSFTGEDPDGKEVLKVKKKFALGNAAEAVYLNTPTKSKATVDLKGDFWVGAADLIVQGGPIIAQLSRQTGSLSGKGLKDGRETYLVSVASGVDLALITAICICFEEAKDA